MYRNHELHYHIRWSSTEVLDWESFEGHAEAETSAKQLVRRGETYTIEEHGPECPRCAAAMNLKTAHGNVPEAVKLHLKYPWQQAVMDAFRETRSEFLPGKVNAAQRAISARLCDPAPADSDEQRAIREALQSLKALLPERSEPENSHSKTEVA